MFWEYDENRNHLQLFNIHSIIRSLTANIKIDLILQCRVRKFPKTMDFFGFKRITQYSQVKKVIIKIKCLILIYPVPYLFIYWQFYLWSEKNDTHFWWHGWILNVIMYACVWLTACNHSILNQSFFDLYSLCFNISPLC